VTVFIVAKYSCTNMTEYFPSSSSSLSFYSFCFFSLLCSLLCSFHLLKSYRLLVKECNVSVEIKVTLHETESVTGAPYNINVTVCHTAETLGRRVWRLEQCRLQVTAKKHLWSRYLEAACRVPIKSQHGRFLD